MQNGAVQLQVPVEMFRRSTMQMQLCWSNTGWGIKAAGARKELDCSCTLGQCGDFHLQNTCGTALHVAQRCMERSDEDWAMCL